MHVRLLFPAATDPRAPHLAVASLAASLRGAGVHVSVHDADVGALWWLITPERLAAAAAHVAGAAAAAQRRGDPDADRLALLAGWAPALVEAAPAALRALRDPDAFFDPDRHHEARRAVNLALEVASAAHGSARYALSPAAYDVRDIDASRLDDLVAATADGRHDLLDDYHRDVVAAVEADEPDVVGVSILNRQQVVPGLRLARMLTARGWFVVIGGTVYAKFPGELAARPGFFDVFCRAVVPYEGETALAALAARLDGAGSDGGARAAAEGLAGVPNVVWADRHGAVHANATHVEDVSALPTPDFDGLPLGHYLTPVPVLPILTGKGCYFNRCRFCDIPAINRVAGKPYRVRSADRVAGDVAALQARHGARHFVITDEALSPRFLLELADALDARPGLDARFVGYARLEAGFTPRVFDRLHRMGVRKLFFGLESGSQAVLDHMDKGVRVEAARRALRACAGAGIAAHVFSIVGFPEETEAQARETLQFLLDEAPTLAHPSHTFDVHPFGLDLRTDYFERAGSFGIDVDADHLAGRDFPISVVRWRNTRGLDAARAGELIEEFTAALAAAHRPGGREHPEQQWPGFEEYAVLYGDRYGAGPFPWRLNLPPDDDPTPYRLEWAASVRVEALGDGMVVHAPGTSRAVSGAALQALARAAGPAPAARLLDDLVARLGLAAGTDDAEQARRDLRAVVDRLLGSRAMWLRPQRPGEP